MDIEAFYNKLQKLDIDLMKVLIVEEESDTILNLNKEQMHRGEDYNGKKITPTYSSKSYATEKNKQNSAPGYGVPDWEKTGKLRQQMDLVTGLPNDKSYTIL
jgi:hypothetical protein